MATTASRESYSPESSVRTSISSMALLRPTSSSPTSATEPASPSASAISSSRAASSSRDRSFSIRLISPVR
jgi:hypothetical protein